MPISGTNFEQCKSLLTVLTTTRTSNLTTKCSVLGGKTVRNGMQAYILVAVYFVNENEMFIS